MNTKKENSLHLLIMLFAIIAVLVGVYEIIQGDKFSEHLSTIFIGISLFGVGIINYKSLKRKKSNNKGFK